MGAYESKKNKSEKRMNLSSNRPAAGGKTGEQIKDVLLVYRACDKNQRRAVKLFRDALVRAGEPLINIHKEIDIIKEEPFLEEDLNWLSKLNNVILIRLSPDGIAEFERIIREKQFIGNNEILHDKIMAVSFGENLPQGWLPAGVGRGTQDQKDFCFGFDDESSLTAEDFESASSQGKMNSLVTAIVATR